MPWDDAAASSKGCVMSGCSVPDVRAYARTLSLSLRFLFLLLPTANDASFALKVLDQSKFGKNTLFFNKFSDVERFASVETQWAEPADTPFVPKVRCPVA